VFVGQDDGIDADLVQDVVDVFGPIVDQHDAVHGYPKKVWVGGGWGANAKRGYTLAYYFIRINAHIRIIVIEFLWKCMQGGYHNDTIHWPYNWHLSRFYW